MIESPSYLWDLFVFSKLHPELVRTPKRMRSLWITQFSWFVWSKRGLALCRKHLVSLSDCACVNKSFCPTSIAVPISTTLSLGEIVGVQGNRELPICYWCINRGVIIISETNVRRVNNWTRNIVDTYHFMHVIVVH